MAVAMIQRIPGLSDEARAVFGMGHLSVHQLLDGRASSPGRRLKGCQAPLQTETPQLLVQFWRSHRYSPARWGQRGSKLDGFNGRSAGCYRRHRGDGIQDQRRHRSLSREPAIPFQALTYADTGQAQAVKKGYDKDNGDYEAARDALSVSQAGKPAKEPSHSLRSSSRCGGGRRFQGRHGR